MLAVMFMMTMATPVMKPKCVYAASIPVTQFTSNTLSNGKWSQYAVIERRKNNKDCYVSIYYDGRVGDSMDIQMLNKNHRVVWSENKTLTRLYGGKKIGTMRTYRLGKDVAYIQVRLNKGNLKKYGTVTISAAIQDTNVKTIRKG